MAGSICSFIIHESVTTQKTTYFPGAGFCSAGWFRCLFVSILRWIFSDLSNRRRWCKDLCKGKPRCGNMFTNSLWEYLVIFLVISFMIYLFSTLSLYYLGSLGSLQVCHGTLIFEQSKSVHLNLNFCIFILCQVWYFSSSVKSVWGKHCSWVFEN